MIKQIITDDRLGESCISALHPSGLKILICPKTEFATAYALFGTKYGSIDTRVRIKGEEEYTDVPVQIFGPFEAPVYRVERRYRLRMVIKCRLTRRSREMWRELMRRFMRSDASRGAHAPTLSIDFNPSSI